MNLFAIAPSKLNKINIASMLFFENSRYSTFTPSPSAIEMLKMKIIERASHPFEFLSRSVNEGEKFYVRT